MESKQQLMNQKGVIHEVMVILAFLAILGIFLLTYFPPLVTVASTDTVYGTGTDLNLLVVGFPFIAFIIVLYAIALPRASPV